MSGAAPPEDATVRLRETLDAFLADFDFAAARARDPVAFVHRYGAADDRALVGLFAALLAYGRVQLIARALEDVCRRIGPSPAAAAAADARAYLSGKVRFEPEGGHPRFAGFVYRLTRPADLTRLWLGVGALYAEGRSVEDALLAADAPGEPGLDTALAGLRDALLAPTADFPPRRAFEHFFPDPRRGSAAKRLRLYLRWMVRGPDGVDLGLFTRLSPARLTMPVDTHIHRIAGYLGLTGRRTADARAAAEITAALRRLEPADPLRYDFALTHLGIAGDCARRRVASICERCVLSDICRLDAAGDVRGWPAPPQP